MTLRSDRTLSSLMTYLNFNADSAVHTISDNHTVDSQYL